MSETVTTTSPGETIDLGRSFAFRLRPGDVVALLGDLGTGKTRFVMGVCEALGARGHIASPTFTLINEYPAPFGIVAHIDLYRIGFDPVLKGSDFVGFQSGKVPADIAEEQRLGLARRHVHKRGKHRTEPAGLPCTGRRGAFGRRLSRGGLH